MLTRCLQENCTVAETGVCLLNNSPESCPNRIDEAEGADLEKGAEEQRPPLEERSPNPRFPLSLSLTPCQVRQVMSERYCRLIGILGLPDAGKTASLVSLYLMVSRGRLKGFTYADSRSLIAFDEISRGARRWNAGQPPEQFTNHTELADERTAGFLHLRLRQTKQGEAVDLLLPDLPGEWSAALVDSNRVDRLQFLKRADVVWLMMDGQQLSKPGSRQLAVHRTRLLMQRLASLLQPAPPVILVVTRRDQVKPDQAAIEPLLAEAQATGIELKIVWIASFADVGSGTRPGEGIAELIAASVLPPAETPALWPETDDVTMERAMMRFRKTEARL